MVSSGAAEENFSNSKGGLEPHAPPLLFHLGRDASEKRNVAAQHPDVLARIAAAVNAHQAAVVPGPPQLQ